MNLRDLPNIGPVLAANLQKIGMDTPEALKKMGAEKAWLAIRCQVDSDACLHQLQALAGAATDTPKKELSQERRAELKEFFEANR